MNKKMNKKTTRRPETKSFFSIFLLATFSILVLYLALNLLPSLWDGIRAIPIVAYLVYLVGSVIAIVAIASVYRKPFYSLFIGILTWIVISVLFLLIVSITINFDAVSAAFKRALPIELVIGYLLSFLVVGFSGIYSGLFMKKPKAKTKANNNTNTNTIDNTSDNDGN